MVRKMRCKWVLCILSICMMFTLMPNRIVSAQEGGMNVNGSELEMWIGDTQVCAADVSVSNGEVREFNGNQLYKIYSGDEYDVYARTNQEGKAEQLYIQPTCTDGTLDIPGIRILGSGDVCLLCSVMEGVADSTQITVNLNEYTGTEEARKGYAVYSEFLSEEQGGRRSDKVKFSFDDGSIRTNEETGEVTGSSVNVNGRIKATSFSSTDVVAINFGSEAKPLDYALEFVYGQSYDNEWDLDGYYEIEIQKAKTNAYINNSFVKDGSYLDGPDTVSNCYKSLWIYNDAALTITDASDDNNSEEILGNIKTMRVMTGGSINIVGEESTANAIKVPENVRASYFSSVGTYRTIEQNGERIQNFVETVDCVVDSLADGYDAVTNPTPHRDTEGRYSYTKSNNQVSLVSTSKSLSIIGVAQDIENGHFEVESCSGIMNEKGDFWAEEGTPVTFTLVPDAGYQYKPGTFYSNDFPVVDNSLFKKTDDPGVYIYTMGPNACSITCEFEEANDEMDVQSENVGVASIDMGENDLSGTMEFAVSDATDISDEIKTDIEEKAGEYEVGSILDLTLDQKINTITGEDAWKTNITELEHDMSISLSLDENLADEEDYEIIRVHNGVSEVVDASYNPETDTLTFDTDRFSTYAIAYKKAPSHTHAGTKIDEVKATCAAYGVKEYYKCSCGKYFEDAACEKEITDLDAWKTGAGLLAKKDHSLKKTEAKAATCVAAGNKEYWTCSDCKKVYADAEGKTETTVAAMTVAATGHKWDNGTVTKEATATEDGVKTYHCTNTGCTEAKTEAIPATGVPATGTEIRDEKGTASYEVTGSDAQNPTATYTATTSSTTKTVTIPATVTVDGVTYKVTAIADGAFKGNKTITKVTIPKNVTTIGANAFNGCTKLKTVTVGSNVTSVGANAFKGCKALTKITLPSKTTKIGANAFNGCTKLKTITIKSKNLTSKSVSSNAFKGVSSKATIKVPKGKAKSYKTLFQKKGLSKKVNVK